MCDSQGRPINLFVTAGQVSDYISARAFVDSLPNVQWVLGDRGYDAAQFMVSFGNNGIRICLSDRKQPLTSVKYDKRRYKRRNRIEIMFGRLKNTSAWHPATISAQRCVSPPSHAPPSSFFGCEARPEFLVISCAGGVSVGPLRPPASSLSAGPSWPGAVPTAIPPPVRGQVPTTSGFPPQARPPPLGVGSNPEATPRPVHLRLLPPDVAAAPGSWPGAWAARPPPGAPHRCAELLPCTIAGPLRAQVSQRSADQDP